MNEAISEVMKQHYKTGKIFHIHATGKLGKELMPALLGDEYTAILQSGNVEIKEYINNMDECMAAADVVIGRAGAITLSELQAAGRASILIPSPNVSANHQYHNAMVLVQKDAAVVIEEKDLTGEHLWEEVNHLFNNPERLKLLGENAQKMAIIDSNERIYREVMKLLSH
ncbi:MAG: glycosyltransferase, partial [Oscillospiraceae bacterium]